jgi:Polyketide cyclase / dehydrase and lipid transport
MVQVVATHDFDVSAATLWALIGDFGDTSKWSGRPTEACVCEGEGVGALRTLTVADGSVIVDRLEAQGPNFYSYSIVTSPLPVRSYLATMTVDSVTEATSRLTWQGEIEPLNISEDAAAAFFKQVYRDCIAMMKRQLSHAVVSHG